MHLSKHIFLQICSFIFLGKLYIKKKKENHEIKNKKYRNLKFIV